MATLDDYIDQVRQNVHDLTGADWSDAELTKHINNARTRVALDTHCVRQFKTGLQAIGGQEQYPMTGAVGNVVITAAGSGYSSAPTVVFTGGGFSTTAAATATVESGAVTAITMTSWGEGYTSVPAVSFTGGGGTGATGTATTLIKVQDIVSISVLWNNLRYTFSYIPFTGFQAYMRMNPLMQQNPGIWTNIPQAKVVFLYPIPNEDQVYELEWDCVCLPNDLTTGSEEDVQIIPPNDDGVQFYASHMALLKLQNYDQAMVMRNMYKARIKEILITQQDVKITNPYRAYAGRIWRS